MIFILEGVDKCGKTTLANKLRDEFGFKVIKCSQPEGDPYVEYLEKLSNIKGDVVFDRFCYGELVYGPVYRGKSALAPWQVRNIELKLLTLNPCVIYCHDEIRRIKARFKRENETFAKEEHIKEMLTRYEQVMLDSRIPVVSHRMEGKTDLTIGNALGDLVELIKKTEPKRKLKTVIGNTFDPKLILVGETRNQRQPYASVQQPFDVGPASDYLFKRLEKVFTLDLTMILNQDSPELPRIKNLYPEATIIALGGIAHKTLHDLKVDHLEAPHPQYLSRFKPRSTELLKVFKKVYEAKV